jgi:hypothetical protein
MVFESPCQNATACGLKFITPSNLPEGAIPLVAEIYSGELRAVNGFGVSLSLLSRQEKEEGSFSPGGDTFFTWNSVVRISLASP